MDANNKISYTEGILRVSVINKYRQVLDKCKYSAKGLSGDHWNIESAKSLTM